MVKVVVRVPIDNSLRHHLWREYARTRYIVGDCTPDSQLGMVRQMGMVLVPPAPYSVEVEGHGRHGTPRWRPQMHCMQMQLQLQLQLVLRV